MELLEDYSSIAGATAGGVSLCIGMFDGVHRGHQLLLERARAYAERHGLRTMVFTFRDHPLSLLAPPYAPPLLSTPEEKAATLAEAGVELLAMIPFTAEFAALPAEVFLEEWVAGAMHARRLVCGEDFRFGQGGRGEFTLLEREGPRLGFSVEVCAARLEGNNPIKSTRIRQDLLEGKVESAHQLLGRPYRLSGRVVTGDRRGRTIGFPTANLEPPARRLVPHDGVYAVRVRWRDEAAPGQPEHRHGAMLNIGQRPTFDGQRRSIEAYLFDFEGDLYGRTLELEFIARVREERRFESVDALVAQLRQDELECRRRLNG